MFPGPDSFNNGLVARPAFWSRLLRGALEDADEAVVVMTVLATAEAVVDIIVGLDLAPVRVIVLVLVPVLVPALWPIDEARDSEDGNRFNPFLVAEWQFGLEARVTKGGCVLEV